MSGLHIIINLFPLLGETAAVLKILIVGVDLHVDMETSNMLAEDIADSLINRHRRGLPHGDSCMRNTLQ